MMTTLYICVDLGIALLALSTGRVVQVDACAGIRRAEPQRAVGLTVYVDPMLQHILQAHDIIGLCWIANVMYNAISHTKCSMHVMQT
jgi:hypothetical protein